MSLILDILASGSSRVEILENYPGLTEEDILACIAYGSEMARERYVALPVEGQFDWAVIDRIIEKWTAHGLGKAWSAWRLHEDSPPYNVRLSEDPDQPSFFHETLDVYRAGLDLVRWMVAMRERRQVPWRSASTVVSTPVYRRALRETCRDRPIPGVR